MKKTNADINMFQPQASDAQSEGDRMSIMSGISGTGVIDREDRYSGNEGVVSQPHWMWIAAGSCRIDPLQPPASWFVTQEAVSSQLSLAGEPWRVNILQVAPRDRGAMDRASACGASSPGFDSRLIPRFFLHFGIRW